MPSVDEYVHDFYDVINPILGVEVVNKQQVIHAGAVAKRALVRKREELTRGITKAWKDGFAQLKRENDEMQAYLQEAHGYVHGDINDSVADMLKKCKK